MCEVTRLGFAGQPRRPLRSDLAPTIPSGRGNRAPPAAQPAFRSTDARCASPESLVRSPRPSSSARRLPISAPQVSWAEQCSQSGLCSRRKANTRQIRYLKVHNSRPIVGDHASPCRRESRRIWPRAPGKIRKNVIPRTRQSLAGFFWLISCGDRLGCFFHHAAGTIYGHLTFSSPTERLHRPHIKVRLPFTGPGSSADTAPRSSVCCR